MELAVPKQRAPRNRTLTLLADEREAFTAELLLLTQPTDLAGVVGKVINQDAQVALKHLPSGSIDLVVVDPPYNKNKKFNSLAFYQRNYDDYIDWLDAWVREVARIAKDNATIYICSDWQSSLPVQIVAERYFIVRNRITWEREKGRGALTNWKNCSEDIWFCTKSDKFHFDVDAVKLNRKVMAPYRLECGEPKDWAESESGDFRLTCPSNLWTDLTVPFWSMPENTDHPTQKPEKLIAKLLLASSRAGDVVLDPFLGSGTTAVVAKKLSRNFVGIERDQDFCLLALKRLGLADQDNTIQGYEGGVFWERNSMADQKRQATRTASRADENMQFSLLENL
jgi:site-specific DNA-methyltransferase (adenine-specific)